MKGPIEPAAPDCGAYETTGTIPGRCIAEPTHAGLVYYERPRRLWWAFNCSAHVHCLQAPRPLNERDRAELARRREKQRRVIEDHVPDVPNEPLATGVEARDRLARALHDAQPPET